MKANFATIAVLWRRELLRFSKERSRIAGALLQPLLVWWILGSGMSRTFHLPGSSQISYLQYFFPGVVLMMLLFSSIFATMSLIEDRHQGFMQSVLVGPGSRTAIVLGKTAGASTVAFVQAFLLLLLCPLAGFSLLAIDWPMLCGAMLLSALFCTFLGFAVAWWLDSTQGYHVVMSLLLLPLWVVSGAMFPMPKSGIASVLAPLNPMVYAIDRIRRALYHGEFPSGAAPVLDNALAELGVLAGCCLLAFFLAQTVCKHRR